MEIVNKYHELQTKDKCLYSPQWKINEDYQKWEKLTKKQKERAENWWTSLFLDSSPTEEEIDIFERYQLELLKSKRTRTDDGKSIRGRACYSFLPSDNKEYRDWIHLSSLQQERIMSWSNKNHKFVVPQYAI